MEFSDEAAPTTGDPAEPGTVRPGGRTARVRAAVLRAAGDTLAEQGFHRLDLAEIARRADVGKTTVYRRWGTVAGLVADLLTDMAEQSTPRTETGSLTEDLLANAELVRRTLTDPRQGALFKAVIAAATGDARTAEALHRFYEVRVAQWAPCVRQAVERGRSRRGPTPPRWSAPSPHRCTTASSPPGSPWTGPRPDARRGPPSPRPARGPSYGNRSTADPCPGPRRLRCGR